MQTYTLYNHLLETPIQLYNSLFPRKPSEQYRINEIKFPLNTHWQNPKTKEMIMAMSTMQYEMDKQNK